MKGLIFPGNRQVELRDFPDPTPGPRDVIIEIKASGMCGSDLGPYRREGDLDAAREGNKRVEGPVIQGHEPCGVVVEVGSAVTEYEAKVGDRMMHHHYDGCGVCRQCRSGWTQLCKEGSITFSLGDHGAHAQYMKVQSHSLVRLPDDLSFATGAAIACGTGTAYGALKRLDLKAEDTIAIYGQGPVGLAATQLSVAMGARVISFDPMEERRKLSLEMGAEVSMDPTVDNPVWNTRQLTHGEGAHKALDATSSPDARRAAARCVRMWGSVCYVGVGGNVTLNVHPDLILRQVTLKGSWTFSKMQMEELARFVSDRKIDVDKIFTHRYSSFEQAEEAYRLLDQQKMGKGVFLL